MKKLKLVISFISMFSLIISNVSYAQQSCPSGMFWDTRSNRCMITLNNAKAKEEAAACQGLSGDEFKACFNNNANNRVNKMETSGKMETHEQSFTKGNTGKILVPLTISLISSYYLFLNKKKFENCKSTSMWLLFGAGAVSFIGEMSAQITYKSKTKNLADEYKKKMSDYKRENKYEIMTQNQTLAFDYLIEAEEARKSAENIRKGAYTLASLLYASTVAIALVESIQTGFEYGGGCAAKPDKPKQASIIKKHYNRLALFDKSFRGYEHMSDMTATEFMEVIARKLYANLVPVAYATTTQEYEADCLSKGEGHSWVPNPAPQGSCTFKKETSSNATITGNNSGDSSNNDEDPIYDGGTLDEVTVVACRDSSKTWDASANNGQGACVSKDSTPATPPDSDKKPAIDISSLGKNLGPVTKIFEKKNSDLIHSEAGKKQMGALDKALATPYIRGAIAVVLGLYANKLRKDAINNIRVANNRIEVLTKMRDDFVASGGAGLSLCTSADRKNKDKPHCFCYTDDGNYDKKKMKLTVCAGLKKEFDMKMAKKYGWDYGKMDPVTVCINEKSEMDTFCKCKTKKSSTGKGNSCTKISSSMNLSGLKGNSWLKGVVSPADSLLNGNLDGSQLDTASLNNKALKLERKIAKMGKTPKFRSNYKKMKETSLKLEKANRNWVKKSFGNSLPSSLASLGNGSSANPKSIKDVMNQANKNASEAKTGVSYGTAGSSQTASAKKSDSLDFDWGSSNSNGEGGVKVEDIGEAMDKNYAYKGDINKNPSHDIFKILSNRYQRSGLRRLFDTAGKSKADEADGRDINEK